MMKAHHPVTHLLYFFIEKCLPFRLSISCTHFQLFSDALAAILETQLEMKVTNYLNDFLFMSLSEHETNNLVRGFLSIYEKIGVPVSSEKTEWASSKIIFLGILLDRDNHILSIPQEKRIKAINLLKMVISNKKIMVHWIQKLTGLLNFLQRAIVLGRLFTRRIYDKLKLTDNQGKPLRQYHHVKVDQGFKRDCNTWLEFLNWNKEKASFQVNICRPFMDIDSFKCVHTLEFFTDLSKSKSLSYGAVFGNRWLYGRWGESFIEEVDLSIEFLELFALCARIITWGRLLTNMRIVIFCDNQAVLHMVNNQTSKCPKCMNLIRLLVFDCLKFNRRVFVKYISTESNIRADALSRLQLKHSGITHHQLHMLTPIRLTIGSG